MSDLSTPRLDRARAAADGAAAAAGVEIGEVSRLDDLAAMAEAFDAIWVRKTPMVEVGLLVATSHSGGYLVEVRLDGAYVGGGFGFCGLVDGRLILHSHIVGLLPEAQGRGIGFAVKQHQRVWALDRGIDIVEWTFDPLVRRNGWFNLQRLGAVIVGYEPNCYGTMIDGINGDDETDRLVARWELTSDRATAAADGTLAVPSADGVRRTVSIDDDGGPVVVDVSVDQPTCCAVPADVVELRATRPELAGRWRHAVRDALLPRLERGATISEMTRAGEYIAGVARSSGVGSDAIPVAGHGAVAGEAVGEVCARRA